MAKDRLFSSFVVCETTHKQLEKMPPEMRLRFYDALFNFGLNGVEPNFEGIEDIVWIPMRDFIISSKQEDELWHDKQRRNGKQGGAPMGNKNAQKPKQPVVFETTQNNPPIQKQPVVFETTHNGNDNVNDNVNINDNDNEKKRIPEDQSDQAAETRVETSPEPPFFSSVVEPEKNPEEESHAKTPEPPIVASGTRRAISPAEAGQTQTTPLARASPDFPAWYESLRKAWNILLPDMPALVCAVNLKDFDRRDLYGVYQTFPDIRLSSKAITNFVAIRGKPQEYDPGGCVYHSLDGFLKNGLAKYIDSAKPFDRFLTNAGRQAAAERQAQLARREKSYALIQEANKRAEKLKEQPA